MAHHPEAGPSEGLPELWQHLLDSRLLPLGRRAASAAGDHAMMTMRGWHAACSFSYTLHNCTSQSYIMIGMCDKVLHSPARHACTYLIREQGLTCSAVCIPIQACASLLISNDMPAGRLWWRMQQQSATAAAAQQREPSPPWQLRSLLCMRC